MSAPNRQPFVKPGTTPVKADAPMPVKATAPAPASKDPLAYLHGKQVCIRTRGVVRFVGTLFNTFGQFFVLRNATEFDGDVTRIWPELTHIDKNCVMFISEVA